MTGPATLEASVGRIHTRFGAFEVPEPQIVTFPEGIPGFESCHRFVVILADELGPLTCLQALEPPFPSFLAVDPATICPDYHPSLPGGADGTAEAVTDDPPLCLVLLTIGVHEVSANLRAPILIDSATMTGRQVVLDDASYPVSWPVEN